MQLPWSLLEWVIHKFVTFFSLLHFTNSKGCSVLRSYRVIIGCRSLFVCTVNCPCSYHLHGNCTDLLGNYTDTLPNLYWYNYVKISFHFFLTFCYSAKSITSIHRTINWPRNPYSLIQIIFSLYHWRSIISFLGTALTHAIIARIHFNNCTEKYLISFNMQFIWFVLKSQ